MTDLFIKHPRKTLFQKNSSAIQSHNTIFCPEMFSSCVTFDLHPQDTMLIQLDDLTSSTLCRHDCDYLSTHTSELGITIQNKSDTVIHVKENDLLTSLLAQPFIIHTFCYMPPCYSPNTLCPNLPYTLPHMLPYFNSKKLIQNYIKLIDESLTSVTMKLQPCHSSESQYFNPNLIYTTVSCHIHPKRSILVTLACYSHLFVYNCKIDILTKFSTDTLGIIFYNTSSRSIFIPKQTTLIQLLSHSCIQHQLCRIKIH